MTAIELARAVELATVFINPNRDHSMNETEAKLVSTALLALAEQNAAMVKVCEAAQSWRATMDFAASRSPGEVFTCEAMLIEAIDAKEPKS